MALNVASAYCLRAAYDKCKQMLRQVGLKIFFKAVLCFIEHILDVWFSILICENVLVFS